MKTSQNPYLAGQSVGNSSGFVGRSEIIQEILQVLRHPRRSRVLVFGQRRIGKTSLLDELASKLPSSGQFRPVYFDLQEQAGRPLSRVSSELASTIARRLGLATPDLGNRPEWAFRDRWLGVALDSLPPEDTLVLLIDEFDTRGNARLEQEFADFFTLLQPWTERETARLGLVVAMGRMVSDISYLALPFFRSCPMLKLRSLGRASTEKLVRLSEAEHSLLWAPSAVRAVWDAMAGHPFLTQQLCSRVWERAKNEWAGPSSEPPRVSVARVKAEIDKTIEESTPMLEWLWEGMTQPCQLVAAVMAGAEAHSFGQDQIFQRIGELGLDSSTTEIQEAPQLLREWGVLQSRNGRYAFEQAFLRTWIAGHKSPGQILSHFRQPASRSSTFYETARVLWEEIRESPDAAEIQPIGILLERALKSDPAHVDAIQLLAEIHQARGEEDRALELLRHLHELAPSAARRRLVPILLGRAQLLDDEDERLEVLEQLLDIDPQQEEAFRARQTILRLRAERSMEGGDLEKALYWYEAAGLTEHMEELQQELRRREMEAYMSNITQLSEARRYQEAMRVLEEAKERFPEAEGWESTRVELSRAIELEGMFEEGCSALLGGDRERSRTLLAQLVARDPTYPQAVRFLYQAVTGRDPEGARSPVDWSPGDQPDVPGNGDQDSAISTNEEFEVRSYTARVKVPTHMDTATTPPLPDEPPFEPPPVDLPATGETASGGDPLAVEHGASESPHWEQDTLKDEPIPMEQADHPEPSPSSGYSPEPDLVGNNQPAHHDGWAWDGDGSPGRDEDFSEDWAGESTQGAGLLRSPFFWVILAGICGALVWVLNTDGDDVQLSGAVSTKTEDRPVPAEVAVSSQERASPRASDEHAAAGTVDHQPAPRNMEVSGETPTTPERDGTETQQPASSPSRASGPAAQARPSSSLPPAEPQQVEKPARSTGTSVAAVKTGPQWPAARMGRFSIDSEPPGADVYLGTRHIGTTPLSGHEFKAGEYVVRLELGGYQSAAFLGEIKAGQLVDLGSFTLESLDAE